MTKNQSSSISIIGFGNFGRLAACVLAKDFPVRVFDNGKRGGYEALAKKLGAKTGTLEECSSADIVILSVPISVTEQTIKKIAKNMKPGALLLDTCSVKTYPCRWLKQYTPKSIDILGTHPMFGPTSACFDPETGKYDLAGKQIVLCPLRTGKERLEFLAKYLKRLGLDVIITTPENHDRENAKTLCLVHFIGRSLFASGAGAQKIYTPAYAELLKMIKQTTNDSWQLFYDMQNFNPYAEKTIEKFIKAGEVLGKKIKKNRSLTKNKK